jgi:fused signal recognition particle receptor
MPNRMRRLGGIGNAALLAAGVLVGCSEETVKGPPLPYTPAPIEPAQPKKAPPPPLSFPSPKGPGIQITPAPLGPAKAKEPEKTPEKAPEKAAEKPGEKAAEKPVEKTPEKAPAKTSP